MFRTRRQQRYNKLIENGLLPFEARELSSIPFTRAPYIRQLLADRRWLLRGLAREAKHNNWSKTKYEQELRLLIAFEYKNKGLIIQKISKHIIKVKGTPDPWQLFREYKDRAIKSRQWRETPRRHRKKRYDEHGIRIDKGDVEKQRAQRRERERQRREWKTR